jgi:hypothetical protein
MNLWFKKPMDLMVAKLSILKLIMSSRLHKKENNSREKVMS